MCAEGKGQRRPEGEGGRGGGAVGTLDLHFNSVKLGKQCQPLSCMTRGGRHLREGGRQGACRGKGVCVCGGGGAGRGGGGVN